MNMEKFPILAFDTSLNGCAVCVSTGEDASAKRLFPTDREQAAKLVPLINETLSEVGLSYQDLRLIVTTIGPGSFTGLRIGLSTARALGLALNLPVQGVGTLSAMAASARLETDTQNMLVLVETKRSDFYIQSFDALGSPLDEPVCASIDAVLARDLANLTLCGDALNRFLDESLERGHAFEAGNLRHHRLINPESLLKIGADLFQQSGGKADKPEPLYLRGPDVSISTKLRREIGDSPL
jgi:tRNA threonylcarbamoyladenosine biosynthesis protein TsaB